MPTWDDFIEWSGIQFGGPSGRKSLRRRWTNLRELATEIQQQLTAEEIRALLGKDPAHLDPEQNDLKALVAYAAGKGLLRDAARLQAALREDIRADPLAFLAGHSGKTFGEKIAPMVAEFWLVAGAEDGWIKKRSVDFYDVGWIPRELGGREIRMELKASSEHPKYLFQQVRHPKMGAAEDPDYDVLLCLGVSAGSLEWWAIPASSLDELADNGTTTPDQTVITLHHGKRRLIWNDSKSQVNDEGWFRTDARARVTLDRFSCSESQQLRAKILSLFQTT